MKPINNLSVFFSFIFIIISAAGLTPLSSFKNEKDAVFKIPVIINKGETATLCLSPVYMHNAWYDIEFITKIADTLDLLEGKRSSEEKENDNKLYYQFYEDPTEGKEYKFSNSQLKVIVDTINEISMMKKPIWASYLFHRNFNDKRAILQDDTLIQSVRSFPIYVANLSTDKNATIRTQDGSIIMTLEALENKKWKPIEYWSGSWCGNSYFTLSLAPQHMAFTRGIKCSGDFKAKCRLNLSNRETTIVSNEFYMNINKTQFENPVKKGN